jgi:3-dehydroquinate dehydratase/shikimate dehydrogenase
MTKLAVAIMVQTPDQALAAAARAAERGADLVEFRIDVVAEQSGAAALVGELLARCALPCILTCRLAAEGGEYRGDEAARIALLEQVCLGPHPPAYLDVELAAYQSSANLRQKIDLIVDHPRQVRPTGTGLILSAHDFTTRPADLLQRVEAMAAAPACRVLKVVWRARSVRDNLEAFEVVRDRHKPAIALCMGEEGLPSRVLARKFGALLTYAALDDGAGTAPGQPTIDELKNVYRWDRLGAATRVYGVVGWPIGHSLSPEVHNAGFDHTGTDAVLLKLPIPPEYEHFKASIGCFLDMKPLDFRGAAVTIPHKANLLRFVTERGGEVEPLARRIGAANTLAVREDGTLYASNTDCAAAVGAVAEALGAGPEALAGLGVAVIGAGGAARAVVAGFADRGAAVTIYNRTAAKAQTLAEQLSTPLAPVRVAPLADLGHARAQVYINCTPLGMHPYPDGSPLDGVGGPGEGIGSPHPNPLPRGEGEDGPHPNPLPGGEGAAVVLDTVYNPIETKFLRQARAAGCQTVTGVEMFVRQAAAQCTLWTGRAAPVDLFRAVMLRRLGR